MALQSIERKKAELASAKMPATVSGAKQSVGAVRKAMFYGWLFCLVAAFAVPAAGYVFGLLLVAWVVVGLVEMFLP